MTARRVADFGAKLYATASVPIGLLFQAR
jgi:hypothetical protein